MASLPDLCQMERTHNGEVESCLSQAVAVSQFEGVAATVVLLAVCDGQFTGDLSGFNG